MSKTDFKNLIEYTKSNYGITTDKQLIYLSKKFKIKLNYIGFIENLDDISNDGSYIINLGDFNMGGTHWTGFFKKNNIIIYYDSYGVGFEDKLKTLSKKYNVKEIIYNTIQHQHLEEELCGIWVLLFLYNMTHSKKKLLDRLKDFIFSYNDLS